MTWTYESGGDGSDTRKLASMINLHNLYYQHCRDSTLGITARETAVYTQFDTLGVTNNAFLGILQDTVDDFRDTMPTLQAATYGTFTDYMRVRAREEFDVTESGTQGLQKSIEGLIANMITNSKSVEPSVISVTNNTTKHIFHSAIHCRASALAGSVVPVQKVSDLASETLTFEVTQEQNNSGVTSFAVRGDSPSITADVAGGMGGLGSFVTRGWNDFGLLSNGSANFAPSTGEVAQGWRCFDAISSGRFTSAPKTTLVTRNSAAGEPYYGEYDFKWIGDDANATLYLAQVLGNPLRNLNTTAWGSTINTNGNVKGGVSAISERVVVCSFYYNGVPTGYTLVPQLLSGSNVRDASETIQAVVSDASSTWRLAVFSFYVAAGDIDTDLVFALKLTNGGGNTSSSIDVQLSKITLELAQTPIGNLWFVGVPSIAPTAKGGVNTFTLEQTSEGKWQKFFTRWAGPSNTSRRRFALRDPNGQAYQLPSNTTETELESLITITDK